MGRCELTALTPLFAVFAVFTANLLLHPQGSARADAGKFPPDPLAKPHEANKFPTDPMAKPHEASKFPTDPMAKPHERPSNKFPTDPMAKTPAEGMNKSPAEQSAKSTADPVPKGPRPPVDMAVRMPQRGPANDKGPGIEQEKPQQKATGGPKPPPQEHVQPKNPPRAPALFDRQNPDLCSTDVLTDNFLKCLTCEKKKDVREGFAKCTQKSDNRKGIEDVLDQCESQIFTAHETAPERLLILCIDDHERANLTTCLSGNMNRISGGERHKMKPVTLFMHCAMSVSLDYCDK